MVISLRAVIRFIQMWLLILICTVVLYQMLHIIHVFLWQNDQYKPPTGQSLKVHALPDSRQAHWYEEDLRRILAFYRMGE